MTLKIYLSRLDATTRALAIAASYAPSNSSAQLPVLVEAEPCLGRSKLTQRELDWAWRQYSNEDSPASLKSLSRALRCRRGTLQQLFREHWGYTYKSWALRRATGGDLFAKFRRLAANNGVVAANPW